MVFLLLVEICIHLVLRERKRTTLTRETQEKETTVDNARTCVSYEKMVFLNSMELEGELMHAEVYCSFSGLKSMN